MILIFPAGKVADHFKYKHIMPIVTLLKIASIVMFCLIEKPNSLNSYILIVVM